MIYVDLDGTVADFTKSMLALVNERDGKSYGLVDVTNFRYKGLFADGMKWASYVKNWESFWMDMELLPWAYALVEVANRAPQGFAFLTCSPITSLIYRQAWLRKKFKKILSHPDRRLIFTENKALVVNRTYDIMVDDRPDFVTSKFGVLPALIVDSPYSQEVSTVFRKSPEEIIDILSDWNKMMEWKKEFHRERFAVLSKEQNDQANKDGNPCGPCQGDK